MLCMQFRPMVLTVFLSVKIYLIYLQIAYNIIYQIKLSAQSLFCNTFMIPIHMIIGIEKKMVDSWSLRHNNI